MLPSDVPDVWEPAALLNRPIIHAPLAEVTERLQSQPTAANFRIARVVQAPGRWDLVRLIRSAHDVSASGAQWAITALTFCRSDSGSLLEEVIDLPHEPT